jgi:hypothetical protein
VFYFSALAFLKYQACLCIFTLPLSVIFISAGRLVARIQRASCIPRATAVCHAFGLYSQGGLVLLFLARPRGRICLRDFAVVTTRGHSDTGSGMDWCKHDAVAQGGHWLKSWHEKSVYSWLLSDLFRRGCSGYYSKLGICRSAN